MAETAKNEAGGKAAAIDALTKLPDKDLKEVLDKGRELLEEREKERRRGALREIQRLAKEHGIKIDVKEQRKRGRPAKATESS
jgi:hypothetical protein